MKKKLLSILALLLLASTQGVRSSPTDSLLAIVNSSINHESIYGSIKELHFI